MGLFKSKYVRWLENLLEHVQMDMSNNYKDSAHEQMENFEKTFAEYKEAKILKDKEIEPIEERANELREKLKGYSHKDQRPYWSKN
ncbi:MAG: hypothetical protein MJ131_10020 [Lachnospiraceae bacterium]|nr:hypothetical protein [Lachnospiraceae bacterium]